MGLLSGSANVIKYVLFGFNFVFVITGIILISVGVTVAAVYDNYTLFLSSNFFSIPTLLIVTGVFVFIIAFFGCFGAVKEHYCMIFSFSVLLGLIFILELAGGISGYVLRNDAKSLIENKLTDSLVLYNSNRTDVVGLWDEIQRDLQCCGVKNATDWEKAIGLVPMSCCTIPNGSLGTFNCTSNESNKNLNRVGCLDAFGNFLSDHAVSLGAAGVFLAIVQFFGIFFACYIAREVKIKYGGAGPF